LVKQGYYLLASGHQLTINFPQSTSAITKITDQPSQEIARLFPTE